jgi:hypothetical protein
MSSIDSPGAVARIDAALDALFEADLSALPAGDLVRLAGRCEKLVRRQTVLGGDIAAELRGRDVVELGGAPLKVLADWLRISPSEARRRADLAGPLAPRTSLTGEPLPPVQPATAAAWRAGALDVEHVRIIQRFLADLPLAVPAVSKDNAEAFLADHARQLRPDQLARVAAQLSVSLNPDGKFSDADRALRRGFTWGPQRPDGMSHGRLCASPALRAELDALFAKLAAPGMCNPSDQSPIVNGEPAEEQAEADRRTVSQRQHDALSALARSALGDPKLGQHNGLPVTVIVSASVQDLQEAAGMAMTGGGTQLPISDLIRMAGHSYHYLTIFDGVSGRRLWLGRTKRIASADQRIVLHERDRGCSHPGCTVPGYGCQAHHAEKDWADGGNTDVDDLAFGCGPHNRLVKRDGWTTRKRRDGSTEWLPPPQLPLIGGVNPFHHTDRIARKFRQ